MMGGLARGELRIGAVDGNPLPPNMGFEPNMGGFDAGGGLGVVLGSSEGAAGGVKEVDGVEAGLAPKRGGGDSEDAGVVVEGRREGVAMG